MQFVPYSISLPLRTCQLQTMLSTKTRLLQIGCLDVYKINWIGGISLLISWKYSALLESCSGTSYFIAIYFCHGLIIHR